MIGEIKGKRKEKKRNEISILRLKKEDWRSEEIRKNKEED